MKEVSLIRTNNAAYPEKGAFFRPFHVYPEYPFGNELSDKQNHVYDMVRESLHYLGLDAANFGTGKWNPLKDYVSSGDCVLIKPNMVLHENEFGGGTDCLFTHPSVVAAMVDYIWIALNGKGKIVIGDAPVQECDFETLVAESGYDELMAFYRKKGIDLELIDFRNVKTEEKEGLHFLRESKKAEGVTVDLGNKSAFAELSESRMKGFRITNYDPRIMGEHHMLGKNEYRIAREVLAADVIISMPKPKTHRKAGITAALKNMVGINASKEYLPHHTIGSKEEGGDAYLKKNPYLTMANQILDIKNMLIHDEEMSLARKADELYWELMKKKSGHEFWEGSWYGNDTIWRTIVDLNMILMYADKAGTMKREKQRKLFILGDMVVSGEKEGPLCPSPIDAGVIVAGDNPLIFDMAVCSVMGFDFKKIPSIMMPELEMMQHMIAEEKEPWVKSNVPEWDGRDIDDIRDHSSLDFVASEGWLPALGDRRYESIVKKAKGSGNKLYVFGAGECGKRMAHKFLQDGVEIVAFLDNDRDKQGKIAYGTISCIAPRKMEAGIPVLVAVGDRHVRSVMEQMRRIGADIMRY